MLRAVTEPRADETSLVTRAAGGDDAAFETLVRAHS
ncbi:MAG: RNA polymerase subunit sigma-70, partial [Armatimonadetes bacterium]|nr:RNA polymerase subunit sigma-70 [Armatimonadota bacterium]